MHVDACREVGIELSEESVGRGLLVADQFYIDENVIIPIKKRSLQEQVEVYARYEYIVVKEAGVEIPKEMALQIMQKLGPVPAGMDFILFDDVISALELLKQRHLILGLISNLDRDIMPFCQELGIASYLDVVVTSKEVDSEKPHPPIFLAALERAGVEASEAVYVGDQYNIDIVGAWGVGMKAVLIDRYGLYAEIVDCPLIRNLGELTEQL